MLCLADTILWSRDMDKSLLSRLDAFEMWVYRRVLTISWTEKISNEEVIIIIIIIMAGMAFF